MKIIEGTENAMIDDAGMLVVVEKGWMAERMKAVGLMY
jgi:hypothetical protein